jgi:phage-related protein
LKYTVIILDEALEELAAMAKEYSAKAKAAYSIISDEGIECVNTKPLRDGLFEIKTGQVRSLYVYDDNRVILIAVAFLKKSDKTPAKLMKQARNRVEKYKKEH